MTFDISQDIKVELFGSTSFIIGVSRLGGPALLGDLTPTWHPLTCGVVSIDIERGFSVNQSILPTLEVGTARIALSGFDVDPTLNPLFTLNSQIKVSVRAPGETTYSPIFTGFVDDIQTQYAADGLITTSLECTDWLSKILNVTVAEGAYIAPEENFADRVNRIFDDFVLPEYPDVDISPAWFPLFGGTTFPEEFGDRDVTTTGELLNEVMQGEAGMIVTSRTGVVYGFGRYYYDQLLDQVDLETLSDDYGFSNTHTTSLDHFCMGDVETAFGKNEVANEITLRFSGNVPLGDTETAVVTKNQNSINALGNLPFDAELYVAVGPSGSEEAQLQSWADDLVIPDGQVRVRTLTWSPITRTGLLNNSWDWDPGFHIARVRIEYASHTIDDKYIVSRITHNITPENWVMGAELWKGI